jgi:hypothetical protein
MYKNLNKLYHEEIFEFELLNWNNKLVKVIASRRLRGNKVSWRRCNVEFDGCIVIDDDTVTRDEHNELEKLYQNILREKKINRILDNTEENDRPE